MSRRPPMPDATLARLSRERSRLESEITASNSDWGRQMRSLFDLYLEIERRRVDSALVPHRERKHRAAGA